MSSLFPVEVQRSTLKEYNLNEFEFVYYVSKPKVFGFFIVGLFFGLAAINYSYSRGFDIPSIVLAAMFLYIAFAIFRSFIVRKEQRFRYAIGHEGILVSENQFFGNGITLFFPWQIVDYAEQHGKPGFNKSIRFTLKQIKTEKKPFSITIETYKNASEMKEIHDIISKYCAVKS